jgi:hypothetical protein
MYIACRVAFAMRRTSQVFFRKHRLSAPASESCRPAAPSPSGHGSSRDPRGTNSCTESKPLPGEIAVAAAIHLLESCSSLQWRKDSHVFTMESLRQEFIRQCLEEFPKPQHPVNQVCACGHTRLWHGYYMPGDCANWCDRRYCTCRRFDLVEAETRISVAA